MHLDWRNFYFYVKFSRLNKYPQTIISSRPFYFVKWSYELTKNPNNELFLVLCSILCIKVALNPQWTLRVSYLGALYRPCYLLLSPGFRFPKICSPRLRRRVWCIAECRAAASGSDVCHTGGAECASCTHWEDVITVYCAVEGAHQKLHTITHNYTACIQPRPRETPINIKAVGFRERGREEEALSWFTDHWVDGSVPQHQPWPGTLSSPVSE